MRDWLRGSRRHLDSLPGEIQDHIRRETEENIERGMPPAEARRAALRKFGNVASIQEDTRAVWSVVWLEQWIQDIRYGARMLRSNPGFALVVAATLALGVGMNTAVFSVIHAVMFRPLPYPFANRLVWIGDYSQFSRRDIYVARPDYLLWKAQSHSFESMMAYGNQDLAFVSGGEASEERVASITGDFWSMTAAQPSLGRLFHDAEPNALVLSWALFERRFHSDPNAIGKPVTLSGYPFTVVGVLPKDYRFAVPQQHSKGDEIRDIDAYIPMPEALMALPAMTPAPLWFAAQEKFGPAAGALLVVARLKPGVPMEQARAEMQTLFARTLDEKFEFARRDTSLHFTTLYDKLAGDSRRALLVLAFAVALVLLIACANIANLLLSRAVRRQKEIAIRAALGAGRVRVIRQFLAESLLLSLLGGGAGLLVARSGLAILKRLSPQAVPRLSEAALDGPVLWFALAISLATAFLFALGPAISLWRRDLQDALKSDAASSPERIRLRGVLVAVELALAIVLLAGAGLMIKSLWRMNARPAGFTPEKVLVMRITLSGPQYNGWPPKQIYSEELLQRLESLPGVQAAGIDAGTLTSNLHLERTAGQSLTGAIRAVSPGYLRALGVPLVKGAWPAKGALFGVVVNEAFARLANGVEMPGRRLGGSILNDPITGVVADFKTWQLDAEPQPEIYMPFERFPLIRSMRIVVRTSGPAASFASSVRQTIAAIDPTQPVYEFQTLEQALSDSIAPRRFNLFLLGAFAATAMILASIGIYGVIAYSVSQRTREIGIRLALGARRGGIVSMVVRQGMALALAGIAAGIGAALALTRLMASLLYDVKPNDPWTFIAVAALLSATALFASWLPALRAATIDPLRALRYE